MFMFVFKILSQVRNSFALFKHCNILLLYTLIFTNNVDVKYRHERNVPIGVLLPIIMVNI